MCIRMVEGGVMVWVGFFILCEEWGSFFGQWNIFKIFSSKILQNDKKIPLRRSVDPFDKPQRRFLGLTEVPQLLLGEGKW